MNPDMNKPILKIYAAAVHKWPSSEYPTWHYVHDFLREEDKWFIRKWSSMGHWTWIEIRQPKRIQFLISLNAIANIRKQFRF
jgi:hypothetical protein